LFAYIKGRLEYKHNDFVVVETSGVGYKIFVPLSSLEAAGSVGEEVKLYTHFYVREDAISLYGFLTQEELTMFELLITVTGIGPKAAMSILSMMSPSKFSLAVITDDTRTLTSVPGIGKKTAQRIILELKDKINKEQLSEIAGMKSDDQTVKSDNARVSEAISALMVLGYTYLEASRAVASVYSEDMDTELIIRNALKALGGFDRNGR